MSSATLRSITMLAAGFAAAALLAGALSAAMVRWTRKRGILDVPNERSSHVHPTPRGGGVSIVVVTLATECIAWGMGWLDARSAAALIAGGALTAAIGAWDDVRSLSARTRLPVQFVAALLAVFAVGSVRPIALVAVIAIVWMTNLYNFMDGIDGIAGIQAVVAGIGGAAVLVLLSAPGLATVAVAVGGASLGFLSRNWSPARIFMGDVGSSFLGFTFGALAWCGVAERGIPALWLILALLPFILDATATLVRRAARGDSLTQAHREHLYQRTVITGARHADVARAYGLAAALLAIIALLGVQLATPRAVVLAVLSVGVSITVYFAAQARLTDKSGTAPPAR